MQSIKELGSVAAPGTIIMTISNVIPDGYLQMAGQVLSAAVYSDLYSALAGSAGIYRYSSGGVVYFQLPNASGKFFRQVGSGSEPLGAVQGDMVRAHQHATSWGENPASWASFGVSNLGGGRVGSNRTDWDNYAYLTSDGSAYITGQTWVGGENRPTNIAFNFFIKY